METIGTMQTKTSKTKVILLIACLILAMGFAWYFQPKYHGNGNAMTVLVTVFSILAGFLIAVMAIVANDRALRGRTWKQDVYYLEKIKRDLVGHKFLFYIYLAVLVLAFLAELNLGWPALTQKTVEIILLFLSCLAMLLSFSLPGRLTKQHIEDLEKTIKDRREIELHSKKPR